MELTKNIFGKELKDLLSSDIEAFFQIEQQETEVLEFKSGEVEINSICKEITAFLNTNGGILVIGSPRVKTKNNKDFFVGNLVPSKLFKNKMSLLQKISSYIVPSPINIKIQEIDFKEGKIFIVEIPQSKYPPHQSSSDGVYYIRVDSISKPSPHGFVQAMFNVRQTSNLFVKYDVIFTKNVDTDVIELAIMNSSTTPAKNSGILCDIFGIESLTDLNEESKNKNQRYGNFYLNVNNNSKVSSDKTDKFHYTFRDKIDMMIRGLAVVYELEIVNLGTPYIVAITLFSESDELKNHIIVIDPLHKKIVYDVFDLSDNHTKQVIDLAKEFRVKNNFLE